MADEPKEQPEDIQGILSDLDAILSGIGEAADNAPGGKAPAEPKPAPKPVPVEIPKAAEPPPPVAIVKAVEPPKPAEAPKPVEPPKPVEAKVEIPKPAPAIPPAPAADSGMKIDLPPRAGFIPP